MISSDFDTAFKKASLMNYGGSSTNFSFSKLYHSNTMYIWYVSLESGTIVELGEHNRITNEDMKDYIQKHNIYEKARESSKT